MLQLDSSFLNAQMIQLQWELCVVKLECIWRFHPVKPLNLLPSTKWYHNVICLSLPAFTPARLQMLDKIFWLYYRKTDSEAIILPGYQTIDSASSSKFHHLALLVALVLYRGDSADLNFAILYSMIIALKSLTVKMLFLYHINYPQHNASTFKLMQLLLLSVQQRPSNKCPN